jgi:ribulose-phosphate 3-epimerase
MAKVSVSILNADFSCLQEEIKKIDNADAIHFDIMDGHFVDNLSFGPKVVSDLKTKLKKVVHLMVENPENYVDQFLDAGADEIIFHLESSHDIEQAINKIAEKKIKIGIAINPDTKLHWLRYYLEKVDQVLIMTVNPGHGGQEFIYTMLDKIDEIRQESSISIAVDGGINPETGKLCVLAGADVLVSGSYIFKSKNPKGAVEILKKL